MPVRLLNTIAWRLPLQGERKAIPRARGARVAVPDESGAATFRGAVKTLLKANSGFQEQQSS